MILNLFNTTKTLFNGLASKLFIIDQASRVISRSKIISSIAPRLENIISRNMKTSFFSDQMNNPLPHNFVQKQGLATFNNGGNKKPDQKDRFYFDFNIENSRRGARQDDQKDFFRLRFNDKDLPDNFITRSIAALIMVPLCLTMLVVICPLMFSICLVIIGLGLTLTVAPFVLILLIFGGVSGWLYYDIVVKPKKETPSEISDDEMESSEDTERRFSLNFGKSF